jgi:hypothetical protein
MRYLFLLCSFVAVLLFEPLCPPVAASYVGVVAGQPNTTGPDSCDVVASESGPGEVAIPFSLSYVTIGPDPLPNPYSAVGVLLRDFDTVSSAPTSQISLQTIADTKRLTCIWYGTRSPETEAVPRSRV